MSTHHPSAFFPASAEVAWWLTAWLRSDESTDSLLEVLDGHGVAGESSLDLLGSIRTLGVDGAGLALPAPGDPVGLGGPAEFNHAALDRGEAVVVGRLGLVPGMAGAHGWSCLPAAPRQVPDLHEASTGMRRVLLESANALAALDVARWRPEVADLLTDLRDIPDLAAPRGIPDVCLDLAARGVLARTVVALALQDDGAALSVHDADQRRALLAPLDAAGRRALVAACSPEAWPPRG
jgi:hypothetical protein